MLQNRLLQTAFYLAETPAGNRKGNKLSQLHQQTPPVALHAPKFLQQEGSRKVGLPWATHSTCSLLLQGELSLRQRHGQAGTELGITWIPVQRKPLCSPSSQDFPFVSAASFQHLLKLPVKSSAKANCCQVSAEALTATTDDRR